MKINNVLDEHTTYEVLITTIGSDEKLHTKPFGIKLQGNKLILNLFSNNTLNNLRYNPNFKVQFLLDPFIYTKALFNKLNDDDYFEKGILKDTSYVIDAEVDNMLKFIQEDKYNTTFYYRITADILRFKKLKNKIPTINRSTNRLLNLLIKSSRFYLMNDEEKNELIKEMNNEYKFILKEGNQRHLDSLNLLKEEIDKIK